MASFFPTETPILGNTGTTGLSIVQETATVAQAELVLIPLLETVGVAPPGHAMRINWPAVYGATAAEVLSASAIIGSVLAMAHEQLPVTTVGNEREVSIPPGKRVMSLQLNGLRWVVEEGTETVERSLTSASDLSRDARLVISIPDTRGEFTPHVALPAIGRQGMLPSRFTGATFNGGVLKLSGLEARKIRISLVENELPEAWRPVEMKLASAITALLGTPSTDLELLAPDGAPLWAFPGVFPPGTPAAEVDLRVPIEVALNQALADQQPLDISLILRGTAASNAGLHFSGARGALIRNFPGILRTALTGDAVQLQLPDAQLATEQPSAVTADLTVRYEGIRILESLSDPVPAATGGLVGVVVTDQPVTRAFPPEGLNGLSLARVGLIGRTPEACELSVQLVDMATGDAGATLGPPGVIELEPSAAVSTVWIDLPRIEMISGPVGLSARANQGRFLWAGEITPLIRLAIYDDDPGGRPLRLHGNLLQNVVERETHQVAASLPTSAFQSSPPVFESELFLTIDLSDLALRYTR